MRDERELVVCRNECNGGFEWEWFREQSGNTNGVVMKEDKWVSTVGS